MNMESTISNFLYSLGSHISLSVNYNACMIIIQNKLSGTTLFYLKYLYGTYLLC